MPTGGNFGGLVARGSGDAGADDVGGSRGYPNGEEKRIDLSAGNATLVATTHGGKPMRARADVEGRSITIYPATKGALDPDHKRFGITVEQGSYPIVVYNGGTPGTDWTCVAILQAGESYTFETLSTADAKGDWAVAGNTLRMLWPRQEAAQFDTGVTAQGSNHGYTIRQGCWISPTCFVLIYTTTSTNDIMAVVCTVNSTTKLVTCGSAQTIRATANEMRYPTIAKLDSTRVVMTWYDQTGTKPEMVIGSVNESTRAITLGSVADVNATLTNDAVGYFVAIKADAANDGSFWYHVPSTSIGGCLAHATTSGTTLTLEAGDTQTVGFTEFRGVQLESYAANTVVAASATSNKTGIAKYSWSAGTISRSWFSYAPAMNSISINDAFIALGTAGKALFMDYTQGWSYVVDVSGSSATDWRRVTGNAAFYDTSNNQYISHVLKAVDERTVLGVYSAAYALIDLNRREQLYANANNQPVNYSTSYPFSKIYASSIHAFDVNPTTKDVFIVCERVTSVGGNNYFYCGVYETPRY